MSLGAGSVRLARVSWSHFSQRSNVVCQFAPEFGPRSGAESVDSEEDLTVASIIDDSETGKSAEVEPELSDTTCSKFVGGLSRFEVFLEVKSTKGSLTGGEISTAAWDGEFTPTWFTSSEASRVGSTEIGS